MQLPNRHEAGLSFSQTVSLEGFSSNLFELRVYFRGRSSFQIIATPNQDGSFELIASSDETAAWAEGDYEWRARLVSNADTVDAGRGRITIEPDFSSDGFDPRSHAEKAYAAICAVLEKSATFDQQSYTIGGRSLSRHSLEELYKLKNKYRIEIAREHAAREGKPLPTGPLGKRIDVVLR